MTTHRRRLANVHWALESIARGTLRPKRLVLWIDASLLAAGLPDSLRRLQERGLEVVACEDVGPHTKFFPYLASSPELSDPLVTADDDSLYPRDWLVGLARAYRSNDQLIHCYRARVIQVDANRLAPYSTWPACTSTTPSLRNFVTGVSGVIYPPAFQARLKTAGRGFIDVCPANDDIWLHVNAVRLGYPVRQVRRNAFLPRMIPGTQSPQSLALRHSNVASGGNDRQALRTYSRDDIRKLEGCI